MHYSLGHHLCSGPVHQFIVMGHNLTSGEGKGVKEIELADDPAQLSILPHGEGIKVVLVESHCELVHCGLPIHRDDIPRHKLPSSASDKNRTSLHQAHFLFAFTLILYVDLRIGRRSPSLSKRCQI